MFRAIFIALLLLWLSNSLWAIDSERPLRPAVYPDEDGALLRDDDTQLDFIWREAAGDPYHYNVYVSVDEGEYVLVGTTKTNSYTVMGRNGRSYRMKVEAQDAIGNVGPMSEESDLVICQIPPEGASSVSRQASMTSMNEVNRRMEANGGEAPPRGRRDGADGSSDPATTQYLLGVIDYNKGDVESAKARFQLAWESLKAEEGSEGGRRKAEGGRTKKDEFTPSDAPAKVQFPEGYKVNVYYRDGWYIQPKNPSVGKKQIYSFLPGSTYKIRVKPENEQPGHKRINTGMKVMAALVMISWLISR